MHKLQKAEKNGFLSSMIPELVNAHHVMSSWKLLGLGFLTRENSGTTDSRSQTLGIPIF